MKDGSVFPQSFTTNESSSRPADPGSLITLPVANQTSQPFLRLSVAALNPEGFGRCTKAVRKASCARLAGHLDTCASKWHRNY